MTNLPLRRITISNFRRLRGPLTISLDAPIVLLHGSNGAGKSSVLSAIEFGLTGQVRSLQRIDPHYTAHLPHYGEPFGSVSVQVVGSRGQTGQVPITVSPGRVEGDQALSAEEARFFSERSFLDQASLGRLLELYQDTENSKESALARFVNELLGLDSLDALCDGLNDVLHVARLRKLVPAYAQAEASRDRLDRELATALDQLSVLKSDLSKHELSLAEATAELGLPAEVDGGSDRTGGGRYLSVQLIEDELEGLKLAELALQRIRGRLDGVAEGEPDKGRASRDEALHAAARRLLEWNQLHAEVVEDLVRRIEGAGLPSDADAINQERRKLEARLLRHDEASSAYRSSSGLLGQLKVQLQGVEAESELSERRAGRLATSLSDIRDLLEGSICPICDRDFGEVSDVSLSSHLAKKIEMISSEGARLRQLSQRRAQLADEISQLRRARDAAVAEVLDDEAADTLRARIALVSDLQGLANELGQLFATREQLQQEHEIAVAAKERANTAQVELTAARRLLDELAETLSQPAGAPGESTEALWSRLSDVGRRQLELVQNRELTIRRANESIAALDELRAKQTELQDKVSEIARMQRVVERRLATADRHREAAKELRAAAEATRAAITERVFTDALNRGWRDVFTRLAPNEPFVPSFARPLTARAGLQIGLKTVHRDTGQDAGRPEAMLSAGNLNTAALSLFIALHLAVEPVVPCLVFDDPVQSMDEVHVAQFAALIRGLSKRNDRQVILAVHERQLFDYLTLELGPAFDGDQLLTIELLDDGSGNTTVAEHRHLYSADAAVQAG
jgi:exonuclease SbcC